MSRPKPGDNAPDFTAPVTGGDYGDQAFVRLSDLKGEPVVLYFYPRDATPGCTVQACDLRDNWEAVSARAKVFGVSVDTLRKHQNFIAKQELPFPLISDADQKIVDSYGVWVEKKMYGKTFMGIERSTFIIDPKGKISHILEKVKPKEHVAQLLENL